MVKGFIRGHRKRSIKHCWILKPVGVQSLVFVMADITIGKNWMHTYQRLTRC